MRSFSTRVSSSSGQRGEKNGGCSMRERSVGHIFHFCFFFLWPSLTAPCPRQTVSPMGVSRSTCATLLCSFVGRFFVCVCVCVCVCVETIFFFFLRIRSSGESARDVWRGSSLCLGTHRGWAQPISSVKVLLPKVDEQHPLALTLIWNTSGLERRTRITGYCTGLDLFVSN